MPYSEPDGLDAAVVAQLDSAYNLARWITRSAADADDVVQEAVLRALRGRSRLRGEPRPWLLAIVRNCALRHLERRGRDQRRSEPGDRERTLAELPDRGELGPEATLASAETREALEATLAALPAEFREVLVLRELEDLSYREIATVIGTPIGTVMSRLARARVALRTAWARGGHDDLR